MKVRILTGVTRSLSIIMGALTIESFSRLGLFVLLLWWSSDIVEGSGGEHLELTPVVSVTQGQVRGKVCHSREGRKFGAFLGIPYAETPGRFETGAPPSSWSGILDAVTYGEVCPQPGTSKSSDSIFEGSEDCLFLNVFVPLSDLSSKKQHPVIVFFGDDNFQITGKPDSYGAEYFMDEDVVLVTLSYRVGVLGFLSLGNDQVLPGNLGLKDQVLALQWIQGNIHVLGGDRNRVTLFGSGSGSIAVSLHMVSPMSAGLFSNGISGSGTFSCPNALIFDPTRTNIQLSSLLNCTYHNRSQESLLECFKGKNLTEIMLAQEALTGWEKFQLVTPFGPTVETPSQEKIELFKSKRNPGNIEENLFLPDYPENLVKAQTKQAPWIVGVNSKPGYSPPVSVLKRNGTYLDFLNGNWEKLAPLLFHYSGTSLTPSYISEKVREFYFYNEKIDLNNLDHLYNALSDSNYFRCIKKSAAAYGIVAPVFLYYFTYQRINFMKAPELNGVEHMAELQYFFKLHHNFELQISPKSKSMPFSRSIVHLWVSFAKLGCPNATWPHKGSWRPLSELQQNGKRSLKWFKIDSELSTIREPFFARVDFWSHLPTSTRLMDAQSARWNLRTKAAAKAAENDDLLQIQSSTSTSMTTSQALPLLILIIFCYSFLL